MEIKCLLDFDLRQHITKGTKSIMNKFKGLRKFFILWSTQAFSSFGSSMTSYALIVWAYQQSGSALLTGLLTVSFYAPYVLLSFFAGTLSDRWDKKKTMLAADFLAAVGTCLTLLLLLQGSLKVWYIYPISIWNGIVGSLQNPASEVAITLITPPEKYHQTSGLRAFSHSLITVLTPIFATALLTLLGLEAVMLFDLFSFAIAFLTLGLFIHFPQQTCLPETSLAGSLKQGISYLKENRGILDLILFLAGINLVSSMCDNALPALILPMKTKGSFVLGLVNATSGIACLIGSALVSVLPPAKRKFTVITAALFLSMAIENFFLAFSANVPVWCISTFVSWLVIPFMSANMEVIMRNKIPIELQGRVFAARNTLQYFTIPLGYLLSGALIDYLFEPFMASLGNGHFLASLFGHGKGAGTAMLFFFLWIAGMGVCLLFCRDKHLKELDKT